MRELEGRQNLLGIHQALDTPRHRGAQGRSQGGQAPGGKSLAGLKGRILEARCNNGVYSSTQQLATTDPGRPRRQGKRVSS